MKNSKIIYLFFALLSYAGCSDTRSMDAGAGAVAAPTLLGVERPSKDAIILSRDIEFKNNQNISYCEVLSTETKSYSGYRDQELYPLASLSKVITSAWALKKLGADYTFQTEWFAAPVSNQQDIFDVYLKTNYDPVFNIEKVLYFMSELRRHRILKIRTLTIDETTRVYLSALALPHLELGTVPVSTAETMQNLELALNSDHWSTQTANAKKSLQNWALITNKSLSLPDKFSVQKVEYQRAEDISKENYTIKDQFRSAKLLKYLKNLNVYSNNYVTDALFYYLGGLNQFQKFQDQELKLNSQQLQVYTGSGLASSSQSGRLDNRGSCYGFLKILNYVDQLAQSQGLNLGHFLYNPTRDLDGTFEARMNFMDQIVFKTGRLFENPALNLAGIIATKKGSLYFTFLGHGFSDLEAPDIEAARDSLLRKTLDYYPAQKTFLTLQDYQILL